jgi:hypothetical protein
MDGDNVHLPAIAPDEGLSAPFNSWFTLFGQFFDHGLDLVNKGGSGTVFVPLQPDDPLYVEGRHTNFMVLTRATVSPGPDGVMNTADDVRPVNTTTAYVDQNQTYTSHPSHQVFLRQYVLNTDGDPVATGKLIEGGGASIGGMATWGEVKAQARTVLGINLTDNDVGSVPLLRTDPYGNFIPGPNGFPQLITGVGPDGIPNTNDDIVLEGDPTANGGLGISTAGALRTPHAFLADIAHEAVPIGKIADGDITIGLGNPGNGDTEYDNELLDAHFIAGDGRVNENIGLTAVHHVFHSEHNRLVEHTKEQVLATNDLDFINEWLATDLAALPTPAQIPSLVWDGERLFQAAKFGTEMQYQHLVFEEFARKIQPNINVFLVPDGFDTTINPDIVAEFAHVVYRFGHSMLTETIDRFDESFATDHIGLIEGFLNPIAFDDGHATEDGIAAGDIIRGMTRQVGNQIDEFVTTALRNNLLGIDPIDGGENDDLHFPAHAGNCGDHVETFLGVAGIQYENLWQVGFSNNLRLGRRSAACHDSEIGPRCKYVQQTIQQKRLIIDNSNSGRSHRPGIPNLPVAPYLYNSPKQENRELTVNMKSIAQQKRIRARKRKLCRGTLF